MAPGSVRFRIARLQPLHSDFDLNNLLSLRRGPSGGAAFANGERSLVAATPLGEPLSCQIYRQATHSQAGQREKVTAVPDRPAAFGQASHPDFVNEFCL
jgi:hypothetical protein